MYFPSQVIHLFIFYPYVEPIPAIFGQEGAREAGRVHHTLAFHISG